MITREQLESYRAMLGEVHTSALGDLRGLLDGLEDMEPEAVKALLFDAVPATFDPYALVASDISATFYEETRAASGAPTRYAPRALAEPVPLESWKALVGFGASSDGFATFGAGVAFDAIAGGLTKRLTEAAADTAYANASLDPDPVRFQRVPAPGCCGFCGMLASRGDVYKSRESAGIVVGRGVPIEKTRTPDGRRRKGYIGGISGGIKARGRRKLGEAFHDHCKCSAVAVHAGNAVEMSQDADKYLAAYVEAAGNLESGKAFEPVTYQLADGTTESHYEWVDAKGRKFSAQERERMIVRAMDMDSRIEKAIASLATPGAAMALAR